MILPVSVADGHDAVVSAGIERVAQASLAADATFLSVTQGYIAVLVTAFVVTLLATPLMRRLALANGIIDHPTDDRKVHRRPVAYMGGVAVFLGLMAGIVMSYFAAVGIGFIDFHPSTMREEGILDLAIPMSVILGMFVIMMVGLLDDIIHISPRIKIAGQLVAAAALAVNDVGVRVAAGFLLPVARYFDVPLAVSPEGVKTIGWFIALPDAMPFVGGGLFFDLVYWTGTAIIAIFVLGACNASNLTDGLDGLLSGVTAIAALGLTIIAVSFAVLDSDPRNAQQIVLGMALMGACLGFLPHNFRPASIFLGDCGSLLLGYSTIVLVLMLGGKHGQTHLVVAGLIIYGIPIIDTVLAIIRRKLTGKKLSEADTDHLHHMLERRFGVRGAVLTLYGFGLVLVVLGVTLARINSAPIVYLATMALTAIIALGALVIARRTWWPRAQTALERGDAPGHATRPPIPRTHPGRIPSSPPSPQPGSNRPISPRTPRTILSAWIPKARPTRDGSR
ncbi:MAG: undecaprenyl/decaprenyl-phosphate alpha-N-acetylglucosaminyl 1-phosphate transferase [Planctomycetes bacterium]|nr:undecaprenyl/decaprenyl-phosphate alpha-N-acetylglucosaminyl 1-phosphate transferase [Planctomycetota bacterium]